MSHPREPKASPLTCCGRATPVMAAWYSVPNSGVPKSARMRMRGPLPTRTYQTVLPCRVTCRCRCGGRGRGMSSSSQGNFVGLLEGGAFVVAGRFDANDDPLLAHAHFYLGRSRLFCCSNCAGDVGLGDAGRSPSHFLSQVPVFWRLLVVGSSSALSQSAVGSQCEDMISTGMSARLEDR